MFLGFRILFNAPLPPIFVTNKRLPSFPSFLIAFQFFRLPGRCVHNQPPRTFGLVYEMSTIGNVTYLPCTPPPFQLFFFLWRHMTHENVCSSPSHTVIILYRGLFFFRTARFTPRNDLPVPSLITYHQCLLFTRRCLFYAPTSRSPRTFPRLNPHLYFEDGGFSFFPSLFFYLPISFRLAAGFPS